MRYDFDSVIERRNTDALKWEVGEQELPMWVADMDFRAAPEILDVLEARVRHGVFGYAVVPQRWRTAYVRWWRERHRTILEPEWLLFTTGVMPAVVSALVTMTAPGDRVLIQPPVYNGFYHAIASSGRQAEENRMRYDGQRYDIDFADLERRLSDPKVSAMIFCNPQNPAGNLWDRQTLERVAELCLRNGVFLISDEIHCDLTDPGCGYISLASLSRELCQNAIACVAPTKTFNLAGLQTAAVIAPDPGLREKLGAALRRHSASDPNAFSAEAAIAAYEKGGPWLDGLRAYLFENKQTVRRFLAFELPQVRLTPTRATYLLWLNCAALTDDSAALAAYLREKTGLFVTEGSIYGPGGETFLRMNIACPRVTLLDGLNRLKTGVLAWQSEKMH